MKQFRACGSLLCCFIAFLFLPLAPPNIVERWMRQVEVGVEIDFIVREIADLKSVQIADRPLRYDPTGEIFRTQAELLAAIPEKEQQLKLLKNEYSVLSQIE